MTDIKFGEISVKFPFDPYPAQKSYMEKVLMCLEDKKFGLLESPTGTGKTLALLCSSLAWLEQNKAQLAHSKGFQTSGGIGPDDDIRALLKGEPLDKNQQSLPQGNGVPKAQCRIVYASRTHSQLAQVIEEFRRCPYNYTPSVILASREQLCINESLATFPDKNQMCKVKRKAKACYYFNNLERSSDIHPESGIGDIESLRSHGQKRKLCPYYISRDMAGKADIIFLPYNYLVDPRIRKSLAISIEECVVIVDEAHNVTKIFEDAGSACFTAKDVAVALSELDFVLDFTKKAQEEDMYSDTLASMPNLDTSQVFAVKACLSDFEKKISDFKTSMKSNADYTGEEVVKMFESCGITAGNAGALANSITNILDALSVLNLAGGTGMGNKGKGLTSMKELVEMLFLDGSSANVVEKMKSCYRFHVAEVNNKFGGGKDFQYNLWCFNPGLSIKSLVDCNIRSLILTSGTLKPMETFQAELDTDFPIRLQNDHVIDANKQINFQVISQGPDGQELISTFQSRSNTNYLKSIGQSLVEIAKVVPDGLLIFFPSYAWMDTYLTNWKQMGIWDRLNQWKQCFVEPKDRNALTRMVHEFRAKVRHPSRVGATFMAVCRGKVSEGIDFADADARAVVITGIPFPSVFDPKVSLKKKFLDGRIGKAKNGLSGSEWYNLEAFRAINQAVGRVIRHKEDFGSILLLDKRFSIEANVAKLSSWLPKPQKHRDFKLSVKSLEDFFAVHKYVPSKPKAVSTFKAPMNLDGKKRPLSDMTSTSSSEVLKAQSSSSSLPPTKRKRIVIKARSSADDNASDTRSVATSEVPSGTDKAILPPPPAAGPPPNDIQQFVLSLKERLEKKELKLLVMSIKSYKENSTVEPLSKQLKEFLEKKVLSISDIAAFYPFIRKEHKTALESLMMSYDK